MLYCLPVLVYLLSSTPWKVRSRREETCSLPGITCVLAIILALNWGHIGLPSYRWTNEGTELGSNKCNSSCLISEVWHNLSLAAGRSGSGLLKQSFVLQEQLSLRNTSCRLQSPTLPSPHSHPSLSSISGPGKDCTFEWIWLTEMRSVHIYFSYKIYWSRNFSERGPSVVLWLRSKPSEKKNAASNVWLKQRQSDRNTSRNFGHSDVHSLHAEGSLHLKARTAEHSGTL